MALSQIQIIDLKLLFDTAGERKLFDDPDTIDTTTGNFTTTFPAPDEANATSFELANSASAVAVPLNNISNAHTIYISSDRQITVNLTDANEGAISLTLGAAVGQLGRLLLNGDITAITLDNASGAAANIIAIVAGT